MARQLLFGLMLLLFGMVEATTNTKSSINTLYNMYDDNKFNNQSIMTVSELSEKIQDLDEKITMYDTELSKLNRALERQDSTAIRENISNVKTKQAQCQQEKTRLQKTLSKLKTSRYSSKPSSNTSRSITYSKDNDNQSEMYSRRKNSIKSGTTSAQNLSEKYSFLAEMEELKAEYNRDIVQKYTKKSELLGNYQFYIPKYTAMLQENMFWANIYKNQANAYAEKSK